jgi:hypothetical protein
MTKSFRQEVVLGSEVGFPNDNEPELPALALLG